MFKGRSVTLDVIYRAVYETTTPTVNAGGAASGISGASSGSAAAGSAVTLDNAPFYYTSTIATPSVYKSGTFYFYDGILINGRYRMTVSADLCGKLPVGQNVTGWVPASFCGGSSASTENQKGGASKLDGQIGKEVESLTYVDNAADESDSIDLTLNAQDRKWLNGWMPDRGAVLYPRIIGRDWNRPGDSRLIECGLFVLDDVSYHDTPTTLQVGGVSKPSDTDFSELDQEAVWKNTSIRRIGETIAARHGLGFTYDADDYDIECDEQNEPDSSYYNQLCRNYGLILKIYAKRLWVYDREAYKAKKEVRTFDRKQIIRGSLNYSTTLSGTFTGGYFSYTDPDTDSDIICSVGGGKHTKSVNRRATSVHDASIQLCAEINNANHGMTKLRFSVDGDWTVSAGNNIRLTGYGNGPESGLNGKYFVDRVTHKLTRSGGFTTDFECSKVEKAFHYWEVGGTISYNEELGKSGEDYSNDYETTSPAANAASTAAGAEAGGAVTLNNAPFYCGSTDTNPSCYKSGTFYYYDGILTNGRYRMTNSAARCGKLPVGANVTGWVPAGSCNGGADKNTDG